MAFSQEEFEAWHKAKLAKELQPPVNYRPPPLAICVSCHNSFGINEGVITDEVAICDICNGDD